MPEAYKAFYPAKQIQINKKQIYQIQKSMICLIFCSDLNHDLNQLFKSNNPDIYIYI